MLHTVNKSPFEKNSLDMCLQYAQDGNAILLIEDAVYAAMQGTAMAQRVEQAMKANKVYALGPDLKARGVAENKLIKGVEVVGYDGFVKLAAEAEQVQSWL